MRVLIAGYGNHHRQDDRAGHVLAPMVHGWLEKRGVPAELYVDWQILPEMAFDLAGLDVAVFVDANAQPLEKGYLLEQVVPDDSAPGANLHILSPGRLLALMDQLGLARPVRSYLLSVEGHSFDFTEELTPECLARVDDAFAAFTKWWRAEF